MVFFGKLVTAMVTPYDKTGEGDYKKVQERVGHLQKTGSDGVLVCGTTGESPCLTPAERANIWAAAKEAIADDCCLVVGTTDNETAYSCEVAKKAQKMGAAGLLAVAPYYNKPSQEGLYRHFAAIAASCDLPIILYNIPGRTGVNLLPETVLRLAQDCPNITAIKDASGNVDTVSQLISILPSDFYVYCGDDALLLPSLALGASGVISVASHLVGREMCRMIELYQMGRTTQALQIHLKCYELFKKLFITTNPVPVKACLNLLGWDMGDCRLPLAPPSEAELKVLREVLQKYDLPRYGELLTEVK